LLESSVFDLWAEAYEDDVDTADKNNEYPFAGYRKILGLIYSEVMKNAPVKVLDIGIGTGRLSSVLYDAGNNITGIDFSSEMLEKAKLRMPNARLIQCDFIDGFPPEIIDEKYDFIISTYALHHLTDELKVKFIKALPERLNKNGLILIGDIGFPTREDLKKCRENCNPDEWDDDEYYFVFTELCEQLSAFSIASYQQVSHCAGLMKVQRF